ncbi:hypothetical protein [Brevibacterium sp.]|uniref:hypothetical protein n=1 Tax=Brevibacterium sp. TaxID=1701 RepID=UPI002811430F|nr:hypothetical protein [Brevibacterium sp.]
MLKSAESFLKITTTYPSGSVDVHVKKQLVAASTAFRNRVTRLQDARTNHAVDRETLTIDIPAHGHTDFAQRLEYRSEAPC